MAKCASCGFESPAGFKFCGGCGASLAVAPPTVAAKAVPMPEPARDLSAVRMPTPTPVREVPAEEQTPAPAGDERRTVTILFADISGFTAMSEKLDPEVVREIMDRAFERLTAVITGFGGTIDKYIGDAVMALFGAPVALGDDPERAVRAGLGMQKVMAEYSLELQRTRGFPLSMRVGINTGKVIWGRVGGAGEKKFTVMGDAVNLASRLEHAAPIGGVLIGEATQRHVRAKFALEALEPIQVKGKAELQRVYRVTSEISSPARTTTVGPRTPFVGRDEEMAEFGALFDALKARGAGAVVTLEAPVGIGKSRMVLELRGYAEERGLATLSARAAAFGQGAPFAPWSDLFQRAAGLGTMGAAGRGRFREWLEQAAPGSGVDARWLDELANVSDTGDPEVVRRRENPAGFRQGLLDAFTTWLWAHAKHRPVILIAEDLHWWPAPALEILIGAAKVARKAPLIVLGTKRPLELPYPWPPEKEDRVITLAPLDDAALLALAHGVLAGEVPRGLLQRLESASGGNPFFAEEIIQAFIDHGALKTSSDRAGWIWDESAAQHADLPMTVEGITQARIDALSPRERHVLQMAAVAGSVFWEGLIEAMGETKARAALLSLVARDLVHPRRSRLAGEKEYAFKHATIQAVAYENHLKKDRLTDHRRVAEWLESRAKDAPELATVIADHWLKAEDPAKALPHLLQAAEEAVRLFAKLEDATVVEQAVQVAEEVGDRKATATALFLRGRLRRIASHPKAATDLERAMTLSEASSDFATLSLAGRELGGVLMSTGGLDRLEAIAEKTLDAARRAGKRDVEAIALRQLGVVSKFRGDVEAAMARYQAALEIAESIPAPDVAGILLIAMGNVHSSMNRHGQAVEAYERALGMGLSMENQAFLRSNLGASYSALGRLDEAEREFVAAQRIAETIGQRVVVSESLVRRAALEAKRGNRTAAIDAVGDGIEVARASRLFEPLIEGLLLRAEIEGGEAASRDLADARRIASDAGAMTVIEQIDRVATRLGLGR